MKLPVQKNSTRTFISNNIFILIWINLANIFNYLFYLVLGRVMVADDYGIFNSLNSLVVVLAAPTAVIQLIIARYTAQLNDNVISTLSKKTSKWLILLVLLLVGVGLLFLPVVMAFLRITGKFSIIIMLLVLACTILLSMPFGLLQGLSRFHSYGITNASLSFLRFSFMVLLVPVLGFGLSGAVVAVLSAIIITFLIGYYYLKDIFSIHGSPLPEKFYKNVGSYAFPAFFSSAMIMSFLNIDIVLVRHFCESTESGIYSAAAVLGHAVFILPGILMMVLIPEIARSALEKDQEKKILFISLAMTSFIAIGIAIAFYLLPNFILTLTFGDKYQGAGPANLLIVVSCAMVALAIANVIVTYGTAKSDFGFLWLLTFGVVVFVVLVFFRHDSPLHIAKNLLYSTLFVLFCSGAWLFSRLSTSKWS